MSVRVLMICAVVVCTLSYAGDEALAASGSRAYEMVSPVYKGGYGANAVQAVAPNAESVAFFSKGSFAGTPQSPRLTGWDYVARRTASGWSTVPITPPSTLMPFVIDQDASRSLESTLALGKPGANEEAAFQQGAEVEFLLHEIASPDDEGDWEVGDTPMTTLDGRSPTAVYAGGSGDLCHLLFNHVSGPLLPEATETDVPQQLLYEVDRGCGGGSPALRLVGLNNSHRNITSTCEVVPGATETYASIPEKSAFNAIADGGSEIFFTTGVSKVCEHQLFVRLGGVRTLEVSRPLDVSLPFGGCVGEGSIPGEVPCEGGGTRPNSTFVGASEDGSKVFFRTSASLVAGDSDTSSDLYMASIGCPSAEDPCEPARKEVLSLTQVSHGAESANVQGVLRVAPDGSRIYYVATGNLLDGGEREALEARGRPVPAVGADNLYMYDSVTDRTVFVADLCSGPQSSGTARDISCPSNLIAGAGARNDTSLWERGEVQSAGHDGRFLVFTSYAQLTSDDTDTARDVYRYDAETGDLTRVSIGEAGAHANGNDSLFNATILAGHWGESVQWQYEMDNRAITEDGSRIVFETAEPLSGKATNGLVNVYEWHEEGASGGDVSLVSSGSGEESIEDATISLGGRDIFFVTSQGLVKEDGDGAIDVYDARIGGGFPTPLSERQPCEGDACQGPLTNPTPLLVPGSVSQAPGESAPPSNTAKPPKKKAKRVVKKRKHKARRATKKAVRRGR